MSTHPNPGVAIFVGGLVAPIALLLAPLLLIPIGLLHFEVLKRLAKHVGVRVDKKRMGPFTWPLLSTAIFVLVAVGAHSYFDEDWQVLGAVALSALFVSLVVSPLTLHVPAALDAQGSPALDASLRQWDAVPLRHRLGIIFLRVLPILLSSVAYLLLRFDQVIALVVAAQVYGWSYGAYQWATLAVYRDTAPAEEVTPRLATTGWRLFLPVTLGVLAALPIGFVIAHSATRPAPMGISGFPRGRVYAGLDEYSVPGGHFDSGGEDPSVARDAQVVPLRSGLSIRFDGVETARADFGVTCSDQENPELSISSSPSRIDVYVYACGRWHNLQVDWDGQRLGDDVKTRITRRIGTMTLGTVSLGLLVLLFAMLRLFPSLAQARRIAAVVDRKELEEATQESIVEGVLRLSGEGAVVAERGALKAAGTIDITLDGDRFNLPLPDSVPCAKGEYRDGTKVSLVGVFGSVTRGHRDAAIPWPDKAFLVASDAAAARTSWLWMATRVARFSAIAATLCLVSAYALFVVYSSNF